MGKPRQHAYDHLLAFALESAWAVTPAMLTVIAGILSRRLAAHADDDETPFQPQARDRASVESARGKGVALIPVHGVIAPRMNLLSDFSGGDTLESLGASLQEALANPQVGSIVLDVERENQSWLLVSPPIVDRVHLVLRSRYGPAWTFFQGLLHHVRFHLARANAAIRPEISRSSRIFQLAEASTR